MISETRHLSSMTWKYHINHVNKKISRALFIIKQVKNLLPLDCLRTLYFALIHPHLSYGITAWGNASQVTLKRTNILQKRAIRTICRANYDSHTEPLFKQLNIMKLKEQYEYEAAIHMYKFVHNKLPLSFRHTFKFHYEVQSSHLTRQSSLIYINVVILTLLENYHFLHSLLSGTIGVLNYHSLSQRPV